MPNHLLEQSGFNQLAKARHGYVLYNQNDVYIGRSIAKYGEYSQGEIDLLEQLVNPGDVLIEVGSNIGAHTIALAQKAGPAGRVYCFEAQRVVFQTLCANISLNSLTNVEAFHAAVSDENGHVLMPDINYKMESNYGGVSAEQFGSGAEVPMVRLDDFVRPPSLKVLKADVEGMEKKVLSGAQGLVNRFRPFLYVENDRREKSPGLISMMRDWGYRLYWHLPPLYSPSNFAQEQENLFPGIVSVNMLGVPSEVNMEISGLNEVRSPEDYPLRPKPDDAGDFES